MSQGEAASRAKPQFTFVNEDFALTMQRSHGALLEMPYILYSTGFNRFYIGQTSDLEERMRRHNCGMEKSTKPFLPWKLVCFISKETRSEALKLEKKLKNLNTEDLKKFIGKYSGQGEN